MVEPQGCCRPGFVELGADAEFGEVVEGVEAVAAGFEDAEEPGPGSVPSGDELAPQIPVEDEQRLVADLFLLSQFGVGLVGPVGDVCP